MPGTGSSSQNLELITIFHYVISVIIFLKGMMAFMFMGIGAIAVTAVLHEEGAELAALIPLGLIFFVFPLLFLVLHWAVAAAVLIAGRRIANRTNLTYCQVIAGLECLCVPFGTALGVFTLIALTRDGVKAQFDKEG